MEVRMFANFKIIWKYLSWIRMGTLKHVPYGTIMDSTRIGPRIMDREKIFLVIDKCHTKMSQMSHMKNFQ